MFNYYYDTQGDSWAQLAVSPLLGNPLLQVGVKLGEGTWLNVAQPLYLSVVWLIWMQRLVVLAEFILFAVIALFLLKKFIKPFQQLIQAAEHVGKKPEIASSLPEDGYRETREAAQSFNRMQTMIQNNIEERSRMLAAMAHDLRTPLTRVLLRIEEVEPEDLGDKLTEGIKSRESGGTGLGLSIARNMILLNNGPWPLKTGQKAACGRALCCQGLNEPDINVIFTARSAVKSQLSYKSHRSISGGSAEAANRY